MLMDQAVSRALTGGHLYHAVDDCPSLVVELFHRLCIRMFGNIKQSCRMEWNPIMFQQPSLGCFCDPTISVFSNA